MFLRRKLRGHCFLAVKDILWAYFAYWSGTDRPVQNALFYLMDRTGVFAFGSWPGTAGSKRLELTVANVGTTGYHCKELLVPRIWNSWFSPLEPWVTIASNCRFLKVGAHGTQPWNHRLPLQGTAGSQRLELMLPNLGTRDYHCKNFRFPKLGTHSCERGNQRLPLQGTAGS